MPTTYKAIIDHQSMDWSDLSLIHRKMPELTRGLGSILRARYNFLLDKDDLAPLAHQLEQVLMGFALNCNARPLRTPRKLEATLKYVARYPDRFLKNMSNFDPEVVDMVTGVCSKSSVRNARSLLHFEVDQGAGPLPNEIAKAARGALSKLHKPENTESKGGRPELELQWRLAVALGTLFLNAGGRLTRIVHDGETGPFHQFLELVLPLVRPHARRAGFALTVTTMVAKARLKLLH